MVSLFESLMEQYGGPIRISTKKADKKKGAKPPRERVHLKNGVPYTPQTFTPREGGVNPNP